MSMKLLNAITQAAVWFTFGFFSVIREILMNKHLLKYIHFIKYSAVCTLEQKWEMTVTIRSCYFPWTCSLVSKLSTCLPILQGIPELLYQVARSGEILSSLHYIQGYPSKPCGRISYSDYKVYSLLMKSQREWSSFGFCVPFISLLFPLSYIRAVCRPTSKVAQRYSFPRF